MECTSYDLELTVNTLDRGLIGNWNLNPCSAFKFDGWITCEFLSICLGNYFVQ